MQRIVIIGCGGSGKTTLSRRLGAALRAPVTHLDAVFYDEQWNPMPKEQFAAVQKVLAARPHWVIDGNYAATMPIRLKRATTIVFLDISPLTCLRGILQRRLAHGSGQHKDSGVYDRIHWGFITYVWNYRRTMGPRVRNLIAEHGTHAAVHIVRSRRAADRLFDQLTAEVRLHGSR